MTAATARLAAVGIEESRREARLVLALALGVEAATVLGYPERLLDAAAAARFEALVRRREAREPFSRLAGKRGFWTLELALSPETLDPRPDSETLIRAMLDRFSDRESPLSVLDLGTGSGCLLLAALSEYPNASGIGVDCLPGAVEAARRNAAALGLAPRAQFVVDHWAASLVTTVDAILANPPYISSDLIERLAPEVARFEPRAALDGGGDGLEAYRELAPPLSRLLKVSGCAFIELGAGQGAAVAGIMARQRLTLTGMVRDLGGIERCAVFTPEKG
ncbi:MAG TPA: peptide chain release factor N(5)-glutamine methyltransferase [Stellaceae bacterium]|nr:peptide chain release factor N(5)-glutamine methyltransferase [Stellaceae bacterium]